MVSVEQRFQIPFFRGLPRHALQELAAAHFVSAAILGEKYGEAPIRVIRKSQSHEFGHQQYYDRLGYIYVYARYVDESEEDRQVECRSTPAPLPGRSEGPFARGREHLDLSH